MKKILINNTHVHDLPLWLTVALLLCSEVINVQKQHKRKIMKNRYLCPSPPYSQNPTLGGILSQMKATCMND